MVYVCKVQIFYKNISHIDTIPPLHTILTLHRTAQKTSFVVATRLSETREVCQLLDPQADNTRHFRLGVV